MAQTYHYIYRITNNKLHKHYYGCRTSKVKPEYDLGIKYFSSSRDKKFILDQRENPQDYKYKVIGVFSTRKCAIELEIKLHSKFNVGVNESFYNRAKQTSTGFDRSGVLLSESHKRKIIGTGRTHTQHTKDRIGLAHRGKIVSHTTKLKLKNKIMSVESRKKLSQTRIKNEYNKGHKHSLSKRIDIYNDKNELMFECHGNFKQTCEENNLPFGSFTRSYQNQTKMFTTKHAQERITKHSQQFIGWYAQIKVNK